MDEACSGILRGGSVVGIHAQQDDPQMGICLSKQPADFGRGRAVETPIEQKDIGRRIRQGADQCLDILDFQDAVCAQLAPVRCRPAAAPISFNALRRFMTTSPWVIDLLLHVLLQKCDPNFVR